MHRFVWLFILSLLPTCAAWAHQSDSARHPVGTLSCKVLPHSGLNLLIHSTRDIRCTFTPEQGDHTEHYKGETGIEFGLDVSFNKRTHIAYSVLSEHSISGKGQLAGKYTGAGGGISLGVSVGDSAPLRKNGDNILLQPLSSKSSGAGAAAGFTYIYLEADTEQP